MHKSVPPHAWVWSLNVLICLPHITESKTALGSGLHTLHSGFQVPDSSLGKWNWVSVVSGILDFFVWILDSKAQDSGFHQ